MRSTLSAIITCLTIALVLIGCQHLRPVKPTPAVAEPTADGVVDLAIVTSDVDLPPGAVLHVKLLENGETPVAGTTVSDLGSSPITCSLTYDPAAIDPDTLYTVEVRAIAGIDLLALNARRIEVITRGNRRGVGLVLESP